MWIRNLIVLLAIGITSALNITPDVSKRSAQIDFRRVKIAFDTCLWSGKTFLTATSINDCYQRCKDKIADGCVAVTFQMPTDYSTNVPCWHFKESELSFGPLKSWTSVFVTSPLKSAPAFNLTTVANFRSEMMLTDEYSTTTTDTLLDCFNSCVQTYDDGAGCAAISFNVQGNAEDGNCKFYKSKFSNKAASSWVSVILRPF
jgi:hypothetical protein